MAERSSLNKSAHLSNDIEATIRRFDKAWENGDSPDINAFLSSVDERDEATSRDVLIALVVIDLEGRWRISANEARPTVSDIPTKTSLSNRPTLEEYALAYPTLGKVVDLPLEMIVSEYRVRHLWGDKPSHDEFTSRFQAHGLELLDMLKAADEDVSDHGRRSDTMSAAIPSDETMSDATSSTPGLPDQIGNYRIIELLGAGGMGQVFKAEHLRMDRIVALKVLPEQSLDSPDAVKRFEREVKAAARLTHPNIVMAHDADEAEGRHFLVMEYIDGSDLSALVKQQGPLKPDKAIDYVNQTAQGLQFAHRHGVVHRDIKPSNLILGKSDTHAGSMETVSMSDLESMPSAVVKILDMGLARIRVEGDASNVDPLTRTSSTMGTIDYMAPEQAKNAKLADERADIYSLGCTLCYLLTGKPVYEEDTIVKRIMAHRTAVIPSLLQERSDVSKELDAVFKKMVAKSADDRYQSMGEVIKALRGVSENRPVESELSQTGEATQPSTKLVHRLLRKPWFIGSAVAAITAMVVFVLYLAGVVFTVETPGGTLIVEVNEPNAKVRMVDGNKTLVIDRVTEDGNQQITMKVDPGRHALEVTKDGFKSFKRELVIESGGKEAIKVTLVSKPKRKVTVPDSAPPKVDITLPWTPGPRENILPGLVPRPTKLKGITRWQLETRRPRGEARGIDWSPDGNFVACGSEDGNVRIYEAETLTLKHIVGASSRDVVSVAWSPDSKRLAIGSGDSMVRIWSLDGSAITSLKGHSRTVSSVRWSTDGSQLATAGTWDKTVRIWNVSDGTEGAILSHPTLVNAVAWNADGSRLASGCYDGKIRIWDTDGKQLTIIETSEPVQLIDWSLDGEHLAISHPVSTVEIWNPESGQQVASFNGNRGNVYGLRFSRDGSQLAVSGSDQTVRVFTTDSGEELHQMRHKHWEGVYGVSWSPDGRAVASGTSQGVLRLWKLGELPETSLKIGRFPNVTSICWTPDGQRLATACTDGVVRLHDVVTHKSPKTFKGHRGPVRAVACDPDGKQLASGGYDSVVRLWGINQPSLQQLKKHSLHVYDLVFSRDGSLLASAGHDKSVRIWNLETHVEQDLSEAHAASVIALDIFANGDIASTSRNQVRLWTLGSSTQEIILGDLQMVYDLAILADEATLATAGHDAKIRLINTAAKSEETVLNGHTGYVYKLDSFHRDARLVSASRDNSVRVWNTQSGESEATLRGHVTSVRSVSVSPDDARIASGDESGQIIIWDVAKHQPLWFEIILSDDQTAVFSAAGEPIRLEAAAEEDLIYIVEEKPGTIQLLTPAEFRELVKTHPPQAGGVAENAAASRIKTPIEGIPENPDLRAAAWVSSVGGKVKFYEDAEERYITEVRLTKIDVDDAAMDYLQDLAGLRDLNLGGARVTDSALKRIAKISSLERLHLFDSGVTAEGVNLLSAHENLQFLHLGGNNRLTTAPIRFPPNLETLYIAHTIIEVGVCRAAAQCKKLKSLSLRGTLLTDDGIRELRTLTDLEELDVSWNAGSFSDDALKQLSGLSELRELRLYHNYLTDTGLTHLKPLSKLSLLRLNATAVSDAGVAELQSALPDCMIETRGFDDGFSQTTDRDRHAAEWVLNVGGKLTVQVDGEERQLAGKTDNLPDSEFRVITVDLSKIANVDDNELANLRGAQYLRRLILHSVALTDKGLSLLSRLYRLEYLDLTGTRITDRALLTPPYITSKKGLRTLRLSNTVITDAGLKCLEGLANLAELDLTKTKVTVEGVESSQRVLPNCKITFTSAEKNGM